MGCGSIWGVGVYGVWKCIVVGVYLCICTLDMHRNITEYKSVRRHDITFNY